MLNYQHRQLPWTPSLTAHSYSHGYTYHSGRYSFAHLHIQHSSLGAFYVTGMVLGDAHPP